VPKSFLKDTHFTALNKKSSYYKEVKKLDNLFNSIKGRKEFDFLRCNIAFKIFFSIEKVIHYEKKAILEYKKLLKDCINESKNYIDLIKFRLKEDKAFSGRLENKKNNFKGLVSKITGEHYSELFKNFSKYHLIDQPKTLLKKRFLRNKFPLSFFKNKIGLDIGCGNGRYTFALKNFGLKNIQGIDISQKNINTCNYNKKKYKIKNIFFKKGDATNLKFKDESFDFSMSYGVFHHTGKMSQCIEEMIRVTKKGGKGLIFLIGMGGIRWNAIEVCRRILQYTDRNYIYNYFDNKIFSGKYYYLFLDHVLVKVNENKSRKEIIKLLSKKKIKDYKIWKFGSDREDIHRLKISKLNNKNKFDIYGEGEIKVIFTK
jgi:ubiquinone/menaquinone biosynthesis C-methylase UbiE